MFFDAAAGRDSGKRSTPRTRFGRRALFAGATGAAVGSLAAPALTDAASVPSGASYFVPMTPRRLCDTRPSTANERRNFGYRRLDANTIRVQIAGNGDIPDDATAAVFTLASISKWPVQNWAQAVPAGSTTFVSNVNLMPNDNAVANLVTVKLGTGRNRGAVDIRSESPTEAIVDIAGVYVPTSTVRRSGRMIAIDPVLRPYDTRFWSNNQTKVPHESTVFIDLHDVLPSDASAVIANLTAVETEWYGYFTAYPAGESRPNSSNLNYGPGENRAAGIMTKLGKRNGRRGIEVFVFASAHVLLDVSGYLTGPTSRDSAEGLFVPIEPNRMLDSRRPQDRARAGGKSRLWPGWTRAFVPSVPDAAGSISANVTAANSMGAGYLTVLAAQTKRRVVSNLNISYPHQVVANHVITRLSSRGIEVYADAGCHLICDVNGWFVGSKTRVANPFPTQDPPPPPAMLPWTLSVPRMGLRNEVQSGPADPIVDVGHSWHWDGTGHVGQVAAVVAFGHRTFGPAPYRQQHQLSNWDVLEIRTNDQRIYTYRFVREELTSNQALEILAATRRVGNETFSLVSCTGSRYVKNDQPLGGVRYRLVSTFVLESWVDIG